MEAAWWWASLLQLCVLLPCQCMAHTPTAGPRGRPYWWVPCPPLPCPWATWEQAGKWEAMDEHCCWSSGAPWGTCHLKICFNFDIYSVIEIEQQIQIKYMQKCSADLLCTVCWSLWDRKFPHPPLILLSLAVSFKSQKNKTRIESHLMVWLPTGIIQHCSSNLHHHTEPPVWHKKPKHHSANICLCFPFGCFLLWRGGSSTKHSQVEVLQTHGVTLVPCSQSPSS